MGTSKVKTNGRMDAACVERDVLATAQNFATALHRAGAMDDLSMRDLDRLSLSPRPDYGGPEVRRIRAATQMSQPLFARLLGVDKSSIAQWERGVKRPSGPARRLLEVLDPEKPDSRRASAPWNVSTGVTLNVLGQ